MRTGLSSTYPARRRTPEPAPPPFSVRAIVEEHDPDYIYDAIRLTWQEFQELYHIVKDSLEQHGRGRRRPNEDMIDESEDERPGPAIELDESSSNGN
jgi:hypothetical protein